MRAGRLGRPHGLDGHLGLYVDSADLVYFEVGSTVHIQNDPYVVRSIRRADRGHHVAFEGVVSREDADRIRNEDVFVLERRVLGEEEFWPDQLVGLEARPSGGVVVGVVSGSAQDRLLVELDGETFEVPFVAALVPVIDLDSGFVEIVEMPGLIEPQGQ